MPRGPKQVLQTARVSREAVVELYQVAQNYFQTFPTLTDEQLRFYITYTWPQKNVFRTLYKSLTSRDTTTKVFQDILRVHTTVTELQGSDMTRAREEKIVTKLRDYVRDEYHLKKK
ncbi:hypothetical protein OAM67_00960 [bacterium]|nr:hypothetical protein [bacterium]